MRRYLKKYLRGKRTIQWRTRKRKGKERKRKEREERKSKDKEKNSAWEKNKGTTLPFVISDEPAVETRRGKRQSWSTQRELRVGTEIRVFHRSSKR